jgi:hypothetical protein
MNGVTTGLEQPVFDAVEDPHQEAGGLDYLSSLCEVAVVDLAVAPTDPPAPSRQAPDIQLTAERR